MSMAQVAEQPEAQQAVLDGGDACEDTEQLTSSHSVDGASEQSVDASEGPSTATAAQSSGAEEEAPVPAPLGEQEVAEQHVGEPSAMEISQTEPMQQAEGEHLQDSIQQGVLQEAATDNAPVAPLEAAVAATGLPAEDGAAGDAAVPTAEDGAAGDAAVPTAEDSAAGDAAVPTAEDSAAGDAAVPTAEDGAAGDAAVPTAEDGAAGDAAVPTAEDGAAGDAAVPTAEDGAAGDAAVPTAEDGAAGDAAVPTAEDGAAGDAAVPTAEDGAAGDAAVPTAEDGAAGDAAVPTAEDGAAGDAAVPTAEDGAAGDAAVPTAEDGAAGDAAVPTAVDGADPEQLTSSSSVTDVHSHAEAADAADAATEGNIQGIVQEAAAAPQLSPPTAVAAQPGEAPAATEAVPPAATAAGSDTEVTAGAQQEPAAEVQQACVADAPAAMLDQEAAADHSHSRQPNKAYFVDGVRAMDVEVDCGPGLPCKLLHVTMDVSALETSTKPFMGGFKHKHAGTVYHHASIQTAQGQGQHRSGHKQRSVAQQDVPDAGEKLTRETQTIKETSCSCQTVREAATQMVAPGLLLDCSGDRVLTPRPYVTAEVVQQRREAAALTIQRFSRGWFARKRAGVLRGIKAERDAFLAETAADSAQAAFDHKRREVERRTHPLSKADFVLLEAELESWRQQQTAAIKNVGLVEQEEKAALQLLLAKETRLLHTLDRLRVAAHQERRVTGRQKTLGALAQPKTWALSNGGKVLVHTPLTVRAAELQQLYRGLTLATLSLDERLDVLLHVKWVAKEWDTTVTRELVGLIDREADLLNRGRSPKTLDGLRKRIAGLFLTCCQHPAFNPEAARLRVNAVGPNGPEAFEYVLE